MANALRGAITIKKNIRKNIMISLKWGFIKFKKKKMKK
jgi:hypothetical protein